MTQKPEARADEILEVTDAEEAVFEALLPVYMAGKLDIEKVRQVNKTVARLLEDIRESLEDVKAGRVYTEEEFWQRMSEDAKANRVYTREEFNRIMAEDA